MSLMHEGGRYFELVDTGGMGVEDVDDLTEQIEDQIRAGIDEAAVIVFVVDILTGLTALDREVAERLRALDKPKILVVNKCDKQRSEAEMHEFFGLASGPVITTSVKANRNREKLLETIVEMLPPASPDEQLEGETLASEPEMKLAIVGRRNVGKSTFINALAESERVIVSEVPGTTRDSIDIRFEMDGKSFIAIDTAGVRRKRSVSGDIEYYALVRAQRSIRRADVVLMFFDSQDTISKVDKQLVEEIQKGAKPCIFVVNKWDLASDMTTEAWADYLFRAFSSMRHVPVAIITARDGRNIKQVVNLAQSIFKQARARVSTAELNKLVQAAITNNQPPPRKNRIPKIFYATQVAVEPPTIVIKCNEPALFDESWKRYLMGVFREELPFREVPIRLHMRRRGKDEPESPNLHDGPGAASDAAKESLKAEG
jgi:GTP-binding protein